MIKTSHGSGLLHALLCLVTVAAFQVHPAGALSIEKSLHVALLPFQPASGDVSSLDRTVTEMVSQRLTRNDRVRLVTHDTLSSAAEKLSLNLATTLTEEQKRRILAHTEVELVVSGVTRQIDEEVVIVARIRGAEIPRSQEVLVSGSRMGRIRPLIARLAEDISRTIDEKGSELLARTTETDEPVIEPCAQLAGRELPRIYVDIREVYENDPREKSSSQERLQQILESCGFELSEEKTEADIIIFGRAKGSVASKRGDVATSSAEVELRAVEPQRGQLLGVGHTILTVVDLFSSGTGAYIFKEATSSAAEELIDAMAAIWKSPKID